MKIHHIAITVLHLEESSKFYCDNFDFKVQKEFGRSKKGWRGQFLQSDNVNIELFEFNEINNKNNNDDISMIGIRHIAFAVSDIEKEVARLSHLTFTPIHEGVTGKRLAFTKDPNGVQLELYEE